MKQFIFVILIVFMAILLRAQDKLLTKVNIPADEYQILSILKQIEAQCDCRFSYNSEIVDISSVKYFSANQKTVMQCLDEIFENKVKYKCSGKYIVLLPKDNQPTTNKVVIKGKLTDENNQPIAFASVYDIDNKYATMTNQNGEFEITVETNQQVNAVTLSKIGYEDTVIVCTPKICGNLETKINKKSLFQPQSTNQNRITLEEQFLLKYIIPAKNYLNSLNLDFIKDTIDLQINILPGLGYNLAKQGVLYSKTSINLLIGYNKGIKGIEIGGLVNILRENMEGLQIAGIGNVVGNNVNGLQIAGYTNFCLNSLNGTQIASFLNFSNSNSKGIQLSGLSNISRNYFEGAQIAGVVNANSGGINGIQLAGVGNITFDDCNGAQIAGNFNLSAGTLDGIQISSIANIIDISKGFQMSGIANISKVSNVQLTGILNLSRYHTGFQMGLINLCDSSDGVSLGLFTFINKGLHKIIVSANDFTYLNFAFVSGNNNLYNIYKLSIEPIERNLWGFSLGFGTKFKVVQWLYTSIEGIGGQYLYNNHSPLFFQKSSLTSKLEINLGNQFVVYFGPSINYFVANSILPNEFENFLNSRFNILLLNKNNNQLNQKVWLGWSLGLSM